MGLNKEEGGFIDVLNIIIGKLEERKELLSECKAGENFSHLFEWLNPSNAPKLRIHDTSTCGTNQNRTENR